MLEDYWTIIQRFHSMTRLRIPLHKVFIRAGVPTSTYYRTVHGSELKYETALKVFMEIDRLAKLQDKRDANVS